MQTWQILEEGKSWQGIGKVPLASKIEVIGEFSNKTDTTINMIRISGVSHKQSNKLDGGDFRTFQNYREQSNPLSFGSTQSHSTQTVSWQTFSSTVYFSLALAQSYSGLSAVWAMQYHTPHSPLQEHGLGLSSVERQIWQKIKSAQWYKWSLAWESCKD